MTEDNKNEEEKNEETEETEEVMVPVDLGDNGYCVAYAPVKGKNPSITIDKVIVGSPNLTTTAQVEDNNPTTA
jgi:hypothetical protein